MVCLMKQFSIWKDYLPQYQPGLEPSVRRLVLLLYAHFCHLTSRRSTIDGTRLAKNIIPVALKTDR
jgi:hypothetical protein